MSRLKINQPDYDRLKTLVLLVCSQEGGIDATIMARDAKDHGDRTLASINAILRWDIFHACCRYDKALLQHLYDYLNDSHIEAAMKRITDTK